MKPTERQGGSDSNLKYVWPVFGFIYLFVELGGVTDFGLV